MSVKRPYDNIIADCFSWENFHRRMSELPLGHDRGQAFERLTQLYLLTESEYRSTVEHAWLAREVPEDVRVLLNLPRTDEGIDLIVRTRVGDYWAIQCKFRSDRGSERFEMTKARERLTRTKPGASPPTSPSCRAAAAVPGRTIGKH
jgi:hypothetical protein